MEDLTGLIVPIGTLILIVLVQISFWLPVENKQKQTGSAHNDAETLKGKRSPGTKESLVANRGGPPLTGTISKRINIQGLPTENVQCTFINESSSGRDSNKEFIAENANNEASNSSIQEYPKKENKRKIWKCACELGILPAGILKTFGNAEAMMRLGVGQCYHKK